MGLSGKILFKLIFIFYYKFNFWAISWIAVEKQWKKTKEFFDRFKCLCQFYKISLFIKNDIWVSSKIMIYIYMLCIKITMSIAHTKKKLYPRFKYYLLNFEEFIFMSVWLLFIFFSKVKFFFSTCDHIII